MSNLLRLSLFSTAPADQMSENKKCGSTHSVPGFAAGAWLPDNTRPGVRKHRVRTAHRPAAAPTD